MFAAAGVLFSPSDLVIRTVDEIQKAPVEIVVLPGFVVPRKPARVLRSVP